MDRRVRDALELGGEPAVELDGVNVRDVLGEKAREVPSPGPDFEHDVGWLERGEPTDDGEDVVVDEEVLTEASSRGATPHSPKTTSAFASICATEFGARLAPSFGETCKVCAM